MNKKRSSGGIIASLLTAASAAGAYEPQSSNYEQDDDGFRESLDALIPGAGLRTSMPAAAKWLQANCPRRHVQRKRERVCSLCLATIPPL